MVPEDWTLTNQPVPIRLPILDATMGASLLGLSLSTVTAPFSYNQVRGLGFRVEGSGFGVRG